MLTTQHETVPCTFSSKRLILTILGKMVTFSSADNCSSNDLEQNKNLHVNIVTVLLELLSY